MESKRGDEYTAFVKPSEIEAKIEEAGRKAIEFRHKGFHCSESVFMATNETLDITDPSMVRLVTGFHGGGGTHRKEPGIDLTSVLEKLASGEDRRPREELPITQVGHLCGALAAGIVCFGFLYGRSSPTDDLTCVDELSYELHRRFIEEFGENECRPLRDKYVPLSPNSTCELVYRRGAQLAVELILEADQLVPECQQENNERSIRAQFLLSTRRIFSKIRGQSSRADGFGKPVSSLPQIIERLHPNT